MSFKTFWNWPFERIWKQQIFESSDKFWGAMAPPFEGLRRESCRTSTTS